MLAAVTLSVARASSDNFGPCGGARGSWRSFGHPVSRGVSVCTPLTNRISPVSYSGSHAVSTPGAKSEPRYCPQTQVWISASRRSSPCASATAATKWHVDRKAEDTVQRRAWDRPREARGALAGPQPPRTHCGRRADGCWLPESRRSLSPGGILLSASQVPRSVCECRTPPRANTLYKPLAGQMPMRAEEEGAVRGARAALAERMLGAAFQRGPGGAERGRSRDRGRTLGGEPASQRRR